MTGYEYKKYYESEEFLKDCVDTRDEWGALYAPEQTLFRVWAVKADKVSVCLYRTGTDEEEGAGQLEVIPMTPGKVPGTMATYECAIPGNLDGVYYTYLVERDGEGKECQDPYGKACGANGLRSMVVDLTDTNPEGWEEAKSCVRSGKPLFIYELHVKDFSYHEASGVSDKNRGRYLAFTEESPAREHLRSLGISHVHLLPIFDFGSVDETGTEGFNWGYDPVNYNVPEGSYATDCYDGKVRIREVKQMIQALHEDGIGVVMDVVYNHTYTADGAFQILAPYYYYRQEEDGSLADGSACGNETASERLMCGQFIRHSVTFWAKEYGLDGFRFDLMGLHDTGTMNQIRRELNALPDGKRILMYGEPWCAGKSPMEKGFYPAVKENLRMLDQGIAIFSDDTRDVIKGSVFEAKDPGFVNGGWRLEEKIVGAYRAWCSDGEQTHTPGQIISYVSVHDNYTLWDKLVMTSGKKMEFDKKDKRLLAMNKLAAGIVFTCLGTPLIQAGEEFARTKYGDENSYKSSPEVNCLDWNRARRFSKLTEYYKGLSALRGEIGLYREQFSRTPALVQVCEAENGVVAVRINGNQKEAVHGWKELFIVCNSREKSVREKLPAGDWEKLVDKNSSWCWKNRSIWSRIKESRTVKVAGCSIAIYGRKEGK